jgi:predicted naringenin-chalcone synthase
MTTPHLNRIGTAVPAHEIHAPFVEFATSLLSDDRARTLFVRMAERAGIERRHSIFQAGDLAAGEVDAGHFYRRGDFPSTAARMALYGPAALALAIQAIESLDIDPPEITHLIVASCTGFTAPGLDLHLAAHFGLRPDVERTLIGFMGCSAAVPALRAAHHAVRSDPDARVLVVNLELCTLHMQETADIELALSSLLFADGCAAALVTADPTGLALDDFRAAIIPDSADHITWRIADQGFLMHLSGKVPGRIVQALRHETARTDAAGLLHGQGTQCIRHWAIHAGGRSVLDAVEIGLGLGSTALAHSRAILRDFGNMSSATIMFVLQRMLAAADEGPGLAMAFGPGMVAETFRFRLVP